MFTMTFGSDSGPVTATVHPPHGEAGISMLVLRTGDHKGDFTLFRDGPLALEQILDLGYEIVNAARKLMPPNDADESAVTHDFRPPSEAGHVPFAINDAIEHDEAMAAMPDCYDPDNDDRPNLVVHP